MAEQDSIFIDGFGIAEYRSFGTDVQRIGPLKKVNLFIGQNNSGKSNILLFLKNHYETALKREALKFSPEDRHIGQSTGKQIMEFGLRFGGNNFDALLKRFEGRLRADSIELIRKILQSKTLSQGSEISWFRYEGAGRDALSAKLTEDILAEKIFVKEHDWYNIWHLLSRMDGGAMKEHWIPETLRILSPVNLPPTKVALIPEIRRIYTGEIKSDDFSGLGIIERLAMLQNAPYNKHDDKKRFERINEFVQSVLGNKGAKLHVPFNRDTIEVEMNGRTLPLSNLGMGVHEVIILAAAATILEKQVVCIEEPELHCHPLLQRQLLKYLKDTTENQYFISTHSAHLLDIPDANIFHVQLCDGESKVSNVINDSQKVDICDDLGYRASDLLQANCVIWVEGPSDRIYLNYWIRSKEPELIEGLHYSVMFYGGRLLSHLTADDSEVKDFISLRRLNQHMVILIDSDKSGPDKNIRDTKERIRGEFEKAPGFAWITAGREIENYINPEVLEGIVKKIYPAVQNLRNKGQYDNMLDDPITNEAGKAVVADKVKISKEITQLQAAFDVLDLNEKIKKLVNFIRESNGIDTAH